MIETKPIHEKISENFAMVHFAEINQVPAPYSTLQHTGRVATPKIVPRKLLRYLQTTNKGRGKGDWSQNL